MMVASTIVPARSRTPRAARCSVISASRASPRPAVPTSAGSSGWSSHRARARAATSPRSAGPPGCRRAHPPSPGRCGRSRAAHRESAASPTADMAAARARRWGTAGGRADTVGPPGTAAAREHRACHSRPDPFRPSLGNPAPARRRTNRGLPKPACWRAAVIPHTNQSCPQPATGSGLTMSDHPSTGGRSAESRRLVEIMTSGVTRRTAGR